MAYASLILPGYLDVGRGIGTVVYWPIKIAELVGFGLALSTSDTTLKMCSLKHIFSLASVDQWLSVDL